ncbi:MAG: zinc metallopeptidase [Candidatus Hydrogenedentes bacterium]|nr:zinc metallopeptidase [Candidatus Hydrogenedentota bacterium]
MLYLLVIFLPTLLLALYASFKVKRTFAKYAEVPVSSGLTGAEAAMAMLRSAGLDRDVAVEPVEGFLSDHYDPRHRVLRLSPDVYSGRSVAAVGVACHEVGHAIQHATGYVPLVLRNAIVPTASIGSGLGSLLIVGGLALNLTGLATVGLILFSAVVLFQLINLPVEFNASARAKEHAMSLGIVRGTHENSGVAAVLSAAAMTYVAATVTAIVNLLYYAWVVTSARE